MFGGGDFFLTTFDLSSWVCRCVVVMFHVIDVLIRSAVLLESMDLPSMALNLFVALTHWK